MAVWLRWAIATVVAGAIIGVPVLRYRMVYETEKRFREVTPGKFYRCGQMSADAFRDKLREHKIKLVVNLQDEHPDPLLSAGYWDEPHIRGEPGLCGRGGEVRFPELRRRPRAAAAERGEPDTVVRK